MVDKEDVLVYVDELTRFEEDTLLWTEKSYEFDTYSSEVQFWDEVIRDTADAIDTGLQTTNQTSAEMATQTIVDVRVRVVATETIDAHYRRVSSAYEHAKLKRKRNEAVVKELKKHLDKIDW